MSIFYSMLRAFGFGGSNDDDDMDMQYDGEDRPSAAETADTQTPDRSSENAAGNDNVSADAVTDSGSEKQAVTDKDRESNVEDPGAKAIFEGVVAVLNSNLPPYLKECLDSEQQCRFIYDNLDKDLKEYISTVARREAEKANRRWAAEKKKLYRQVNEATEQIAQATERVAKAEEKALSADRQKRAMTQRNADLERRVGRLQADIEQYDLEKNSLLNKLRVLEVKAGKAADDTTAPPSDAEAASAANGQLAKELDEARAEIAQLKSSLEEANKSLEVVGEIQTQLKNIEEMKKRKNARIKELKEENAQLRADLDSAQAAQLRVEATAPVMPESATLVSEPVQTAADDDTASQPAPEDGGELIDMTVDRVDMHEPDATGVSAVIADDLDMLAAISENDAMASPAEPLPAKKKRKPRARKPKLVAIDESISESEWLLSSSPMPSDVNAPSGFGYQEPPRRSTPPDNPAQMSLW